jgi:hypothetical protein
MSDNETPQDGSGGKRVPRRRVDAAVRRARIAELIADGKPFKQIARELGTTQRMVQRVSDEVGGAIVKEAERRTRTAAQILIEAAPDAAARLAKLVQSKDAKVAKDASKAVLDRTGHGPSSKIELTPPEPPGSREEAIARVEALLARLKGKEG